MTQAIPPCARAVFESAPLRFVITATVPCLAAFRAKVRPAMPLPITMKSYSFMKSEYYRSIVSGRSKPRARGAYLAEHIRSAADFPSPPPRHNQCEPAELPQLFDASPG